MQFNRIIAAVDVNDDLAKDVLAAAQSLAKRDGAKLAAVSVWPAPNATPIGAGADAASGAAVASQAVLEQHKLGRQTCQNRLKKLVSESAPDADPVILDGDPADETARYAEKIGADLIVAGSHQRGFWGRLFYGSASREVIHDAPCAVFLVTQAFAKKV